MFYCGNVLKIPQPPSPAMDAGTIFHTIVEILQKPRRKKHCKEILAKESIYGTTIEFLGRRLLNKYKIYSEERVEDLNSFITTSLKFDFFAKDSKKILTEQKIKLEGDTWELNSRIDKLVFYNEGTIVVIDFKTSKMKFPSNTLQDNLQAKAYSLAIWEKFGVIPEVYFFFPRFPRQPWQKVAKFTEKELADLRKFFDKEAKEIRGFNEKTSLKNMAAADPNRQYICNKMCSYKRAFNYYNLVDEEGNVLKSSLDKKALTAKDGQVIIERSHLGCPAWKDDLI